MNDRWDGHFLALADECSRMSKDPSTKVGAVIVGPDHEIRSTGFNGFPRGIADTHERLTCREVKIGLMVHAEANAILHAARVGSAIKGCTMYLVAPPCAGCAISIIQAGIIEVVAKPLTSDLAARWKPSIDTALALLAEAGVAYREVT
jgi:dCMP deaminase